MKQASRKDKFCIGLRHQHIWLAEMKCCVACHVCEAEASKIRTQTWEVPAWMIWAAEDWPSYHTKIWWSVIILRLLHTDAQEYHATAACEWDPCDNLSKALEMSRAASLASLHESRAWFKCSVMRERTSPVDRKWWNPSWASVQRLWTSKKVITCSSMRHSKYCAPYGKKADRLTFAWIRFLPRAFKGRSNWSQLPER